MESKDNGSMNIATLGMGGIEFTIEKDGTSVSYIVRPKSIGNLYDTIGHYIDWFNIYDPIFSYYNDSFLASGIDLELKRQEAETVRNNPGEPMVYYVVENIALFTEDLDADGKLDNKTAMENFVKLFEGKFGKDHTIIFEHSDFEVCVKTSDRSEAENVMRLLYTDIVKPVLDKMKESL